MMRSIVSLTIALCALTWHPAIAQRYALVEFQNGIIDPTTAPSFDQEAHPLKKFAALSASEHFNSSTKHFMIVTLNPSASTCIIPSSMCVGLIPPYSFVVYTSYANAAIIRDRVPDVVYVGNLPPSAKVGSPLGQGNGIIVDPKCIDPLRIKVHVQHACLLNPLCKDDTKLDVPTVVDIQALAEKWQSELQSKNLASKNELLSAVIVSQKYIVFELSYAGNVVQRANAVADFFVNEETVIYVEQLICIHFQNTHAVAASKSHLSVVASEVPHSIRVLRGQGEVISIADSGADFKSCYLREEDDSLPPHFTFKDDGPPLQLNISLTRRKIIQYVSYGKADMEDDNPSLGGHGTHVAGSALGSAVGGPGYLGSYNGVAPDAKLAFMDLAGRATSALSTPLDLQVMLEWGYSAGARIHSNSWGDVSTEPRYSSLNRELDEFTYDRRDVVVILAGGNSGQCNTGPSITSLAMSKNPIVVGSTHQPAEAYLNKKLVPSEYAQLGPDGFSTNNIASFSSRGPTFDGRIKPDLVGPGMAIESAIALGGDRTCATARTHIETRTGTSMTAPLIAGTFALLREYIRKGYLPTGVPTSPNGFIPSGALLKTLAAAGGVRLTGRRYVTDRFMSPKGMSCPSTDSVPIGDTFPNSHQGWGRFVLSSAVFFPDSSSGLIQSLPGHTLVKDDEAAAREYGDPSISQGQTHVYNYCIFPGSPISRIAIGWTDPPAEVNAARLLVNDLDLQVSYQGQQQWGGVDPTQPDLVNPIEVVYIPALSKESQPQDIEVRVFGTRIPIGGNQSYAAVVSGKIAEGLCSNAQLPVYYVEAQFRNSSTWLDRYMFGIVGVLLFAVVVGAVLCCIRRTRFARSDSTGRRRPSRENIESGISKPMSTRIQHRRQSMQLRPSFVTIPKGQTSEDQS